MNTLVVIPTFNERDNIEPLVNEILQRSSDSHILVIDDGSEDGTGDTADALAAQTSRLRVLHRPRKMGLGTAYVTGFEYGLSHGFDPIVQMDADFSHRPEDLPALLRAAEGKDVVVGSRNIPGGRAVGWSPLRNVISKGGSAYARLLLGLPVRDCTSGFRCYRRRALEAIDLSAVSANGFGFQVELTYACATAGMTFCEVPITFPDRVRGASKMSHTIFLEAALLVLRLRFGATQASTSRSAVDSRSTSRPE